MGIISPSGVNRSYTSFSSQALNKKSFTERSIKLQSRDTLKKTEFEGNREDELQLLTRFHTIKLYFCIP